jgi:HemY protein
MRSLFWLLFLATLAVALAWLVGQNQATVTVFWHPWRLDMSLNLVLWVLISGFALLYLALRGVSALRALPMQARRWRAQQQERAMHLALLDGVVHQLSGRFVRAQSAAQHAALMLDQAGPEAMERDARWRVLAHWLLAESARALGHPDRQQRALDAAMAQSGPDAAAAQEGVLLRAVSWALDARDAALAREGLSRLPQGASRRIQAVRLRLRLAQLERDVPAAIDTVRLLAKHKAFTAEAADTLLKGLHQEALRQIHDTDQLVAFWKRAEGQLRADPSVALLWLERWQALAGAGWDHGPESPAPADTQRQVMGAVLESVWAAYAHLSDAQRQRLVCWFDDQMHGLAAEWLPRLEGQQRQRPHDAECLFLVGQALVVRQIWGLAHQSLSQAVRQLGDAELRRRAWCALARLAEQGADEAAALHAWRQAAQTVP